MNPSHSIPLPQQPHPPFASPEEALACAERYFEAQTSEEEEFALKCFAASAEAEADPRFDELRAVMGLAAVGRRINAQTSSVCTAGMQPSVRLEPSAQTRTRRPVLRLVRTFSAAAACVAVVAGASMLFLHREPECVAYIGGQRTTDPQQVTLAMHRSMEQMGQTADVPTVENQLNEMFQQLDQESEKQ